MPAELPRLHLAYQRALLELLRADEPDAQLRDLALIVGQLRLSASVAPAQELWDLTVDLLERARTASAKPPSTTLRLLGAVERLTKTWIAEGEQCFSADDALTLIGRLREAVGVEDANVDPLSEPAADTAVSAEAPEAVEQEVAPERDGVEAAALSVTLRSLAGHPAWLDQEPGPQADEQGPEVARAGEMDAAADASAASEVDPAVAGDVEQEPPAAIEAPDPSSRSALKRRPGPLIDLEPELELSEQVPFSNTMPRLKWVGRQSCQALGRHAEFLMDSDGIVDRDLLKRLLQPLECLVRNAVYYGIEGGDDRLGAGKSPVGRIMLTYRRQDEPRMTIETDGLAVDPERIRRKAVDLGLLDDAAEAGSDQLLGLLAAERFSTAHVATQTAGYGVGLDAAVRELEAAGCSLRLSLGENDGLTMTVQFPH